MNKKINYLALIPGHGSIILLIWLFIKSLKKELNNKEFYICFVSSLVIGFLSISAVTLCLFLINYLVDISNFILNYGAIPGYIVGGYLMNLFTFFLINKKWDKLVSQ